MGPDPGQRHGEAHGSLATSLDGRSGGLAKDGGVAGKQVGGLGK
jgi:hypothetical protein